jgi:hypothetical protein
MSVVARIVVMFFAYVLACVAASAVFTIGMLTPEWNELASSGLPSVAILAIVAIGAPIIGVVAALPAALVVAIAEGFAWRSVLFYAALGGAVALALSYGVDLNWGGEVSQPEDYFVHERQVLAAAGIAGGLVYWLFAGRSAGSWK